MIAIDTNLLVYATRAKVREHADALAVLESLRTGSVHWGVPFPVLAEFWSVVTGAAAAAHASTPVEAASFLSELWRAGAQCWFPAPGTEHALADLARNESVRGGRIFDLQIALIARANGAREIWTHDAGFITVPGLRVRDPLVR